MAIHSLKLYRHLDPRHPIRASLADGCGALVVACRRYWGRRRCQAGVDCDGCISVDAHCGIVEASGHVPAIQHISLVPKAQQVNYSLESNCLPHPPVIHVERKLSSVAVHPHPNHTSHSEFPTAQLPPPVVHTVMEEPRSLPINVHRPSV